MPNDPRVRFHKGGKGNDKAHICKKDIEYLRKHPECRLGHRVMPGGGGGGRGLRSIYEENEIEPPPDPGGGGTGGGGTGGGTVTPSPRDIPIIPQAVKPSLNAGEITGVTIGSIAAAAAAIELTRRALEERERRRGMAPVSQRNRPSSTRQSGVSIFRRGAASAAGGTISRALTGTEMAALGSRPAGPIQAEFAPISITSSPSNSGTATPDMQSAHSRSGTATPDMQSARSRSSSGSTTPDGNLSSFRPSARGFQQQPSAELGLVTYALPPPPARQNVNVPLNLQQELERRQIEILNPNISGARTKTLQNEINALEDQIRASGGTVTSLEDRINSAINTTLPKNIYRVEEVENILELTNRLTAAETIMNESLNTNTSAERYVAGEITATPKERMKYYRGRNIYTAAKLEKEIVEIELKLLNPTLPQEQRRALVAEQEKLRGEQRAGLEKAQAVEKARADHIAAKPTNRELESRLRSTNATAFEIETGIGSVRNMSWVESLRERLGGYRRIPLSDERGIGIDPTAPPKTRSIPRDITDITRPTTAAIIEAERPRTIEEINAAQQPGETALERARARAASIDTSQSTIQERQAAARRPVPPLAEIDDGAGLGIGSGREALGMTNEEFANRLEQASIQAQREPAFPLDPSRRSRNSEALNRTRQMYEYMREGDERMQIAEAERQSLMETAEAETEFSRQIAEAERQSLMETAAPGAAPVNVERPPEPFQISGIESGSSSGSTTPAVVERPVPAPVELTPIQEINEHIQHLQELYDSTSRFYAEEGRTLPEPTSDRWKASYAEGEFEWASKTYTMRKVLKDPANANRTVINQETGAEITMEEAFSDLMARNKRIKQLKEGLNINLDAKLRETAQTMTETEKPSRATFGKRKGPKPDQKRTMTRKTGLSATGEQRPMQTALTGEASRARLRPTETRATAAPEATMTEARATMRSAPTPETVAARSVLAPETAARVPTLTAPEPAGPRVRAQVRAIETTERPIAPPTESPAPSAPPSAPETPREATAVVERTPAERAAFSEEVSARLTNTNLNKRPGRQKVKQNIGKPKTTVNPLERFVAPQFRNAPNVEIHPGAKSLSGALSELGSRVPRLVPTREVLISAGHMAVSEGGGAVAGFFAGSYAGQKMNEYFATHPPKNRGEEFGQALATNMVALAVGNLTSKVVAYVIKQGARVAVGAAISGSISSAGAGGSTAILEAVVFATVATTTQYFTTKALEDAGYNHETSRSQGSLAATLALMDLEMASWLLKGGPVNLYADAAFIVSELFIIGFGIWSYFEEKKAGAEEDAQEAATKAEREEYERQIKERNESIERIKITNNARAAFMVALETRNYNFDELYDELTDRQKRELGISTPESKAAFQRQVESAFDPMGMFAEPPSGLTSPEVLTPIEQQRRDVFNSYINWYIAELRGETQPPFNFNDPKVVELNEYSGGTWESAARVSATTSHMQAERVHPLIENAQNEIINAFHNERKTIEQMPDDVVAYANLDPNFRKNYEDYIVADAQAQILLEFNNTQHTYLDMDPALLAIADRDPNFRAAADAYYQVLANQARDLNLSISTVAHLNSLMENEQVIEIGKLNDARNAIIQKNMAENQAAIDSYNATIVKAINMYGDNFEAIIRNINEQSLLSGHTFLYASTRADLYRQLHMEMPEIELVDPGDETNLGDATYRPAKGRKVGDTALYGYRHFLTDEQNQELEDMITRGEITRDQEEDQAMIIRERDRYIYEETDKERADNLNMTLPEYYDKFGIPVDPYQMEIVDFHTITTTPTNGRVRQRDGTIFTYRNGILVNKEKPVIDVNVNVEPVVSYNPSLLRQPDGKITMPDGSVRTYKDGKVTSVMYSGLTPPEQRLLPDQINAQEGIPPYEQLKTMYPQAYQSLQLKYAGDPDADAKIEETLARGHKTGLYNPNPDLDLTNPDGTPVTPVTPDPTPVTPVAQVLFTGERKMPDGTTRFYRNGKVAGIDYPAGFPIANMLDAKGIKALNNSEGIYYDPNPQTNVTPPTPTEPIQSLKQGDVKMPDGSIRTYENGLVVYVKYPGAIKSKTPAEINKEEGIRDASYTAPVTPVTPVNVANVPLQQGVVKMPDGSKRMYIDGKVVSVVYPEGVTGPTINQINAAEGIKKAEPDSNNPVNPVAPVDPGGLPSQIPTQPTREPTYEELQVMYPDRFQQYRNSYANEGKWGLTPTSPEAQEMVIEGLLRAEHTDRTEKGTAPPLPPTSTTTTPTPTTNQPLPFVPGAKSYEYTDSGTQVNVAPTQPTTPTTTTPSGGGPSDYRPRGQEPMPITATTTPSGGGPSDYRPRQAEPMQNNNP